MRAWTSRRRRGDGRGRSTTGPADRAFPRLGLTVTRPRPHPSLGNIALYFADSGQDSGLLHCSAHPVLLRSGRAPPILCLLLAAAEDGRTPTRQSSSKSSNKRISILLRRMRTMKNTSVSLVSISSIIQENVEENVGMLSGSKIRNLQM